MITKESIIKISELKTHIEIISKTVSNISKRLDELENISNELESNELESFDYKSIKTIEDAYKRNKKDYSKVTSNTKHIQAYIDLCEIAKAINNDPDIENYEKYWYPYYEIVGRSEDGGVSFLNARSVSSYTPSYYGSRLTFNSEEKAKYAAEQFKDVYKDFILGKE